MNTVEIVKPFQLIFTVLLTVTSTHVIALYLLNQMSTKLVYITYLSNKPQVVGLCLGKI